MLVQLNISNFAIIKHLEITLGPGLNIISGETGTGKSIIINAMNLILGGRASADLIRSGCNEARVEAYFTFPEGGFLTKMLSELGFPSDGELLIKRTIFREGRNKIVVNASIATLQMLSRIGTVLISISGQHENQLLLKPDNHLYLLDDFGGFSDETSELGELVTSYRLLKEKINHQKKEVKEIGERQDLSRFQIHEIERAALRVGEDEALAEEKRRLQRSEELMTMVSEIYQTLYERNDSMLSSISQCTKRMDKGVEIDNRLISIRDTLAEIEVKLEDASLSLRDFQKMIDMDPHRLEQVVERLELLSGLKRKYGPTLEDVLQFKNDLTSVMYDLDEKGALLVQLARERQDLEADLSNRAKALSEKRKAAAEDLQKAVEQELRRLHMAETRFQVEFGQACDEGGEPEQDRIEEIGSDGFDRVQFMISPNIGEELRPLSRIASGGELSRIMLALKTILARAASVETIIFDEVDSGISGATAEVIGEKLLSLAQFHQILCITHLPQIASQGRIHFVVTKGVIDGRTQTMISELDNEARVQEIARLLGGREIMHSAVAHAREMLGLFVDKK